jgi:hypothetical protein
VQRRQLTQLVDGRDDVVVDRGCRDEPRPTVDDPMADRLGRDEVVNRLRVVAVDEVELQARRARVDGQDRQVSTARSSR